MYYNYYFLGVYEKTKVWYTDGMEEILETESIEMNSDLIPTTQQFEPYLESELSDLKVAAALMRAQEKFDRILKDTDNPFYKSKYATLDQVISAVRPSLRSEGLVILQENVQDGERYGILTRLVHIESGEELVSTLLAKPKDATIQQIAGLLTYCRRYEYHTITGTASEDDDGASASGTSTESGRPEPRKQSVSVPIPPSHPHSGPVKANIPPSPIMPTTANASVSSHSTGLPAPATLPTNATTAVTHTISIPSTDPNGIPAPAEFDAYMQKAFALAAELENAGVKAGRGLPVKAKLGKYVRKVAGCEDVHLVKHGQWEVIFTEFERLMKSEAGKQEAVKIVNAANPEKEGK